jgi:hypothetical protein
MPVLPVIQPSPAMGEAQIEPNFVQRSVGRTQVALTGRTPLTLGIEQGFLEVRRVADK